MRLLNACAVMLALTVMASAGIAEAKPKVRACAKGEHSVPDERGKGNLCVSAKVWGEARSNCAKYAKKGQKVDPVACLCQDGDMIGACGS
jgi:hypothetical protein